MILLCGLLSAGAIASSTASAVGDLAGLQTDLARQLALAGPHDGAYVYDINARQTLFSQRAATLRPPASVEKLYTATAALARMGPTARLSTTVLGTGQLAAGRVWEGSLYLRGGGDPTFGSSSFIRAHYGGQGASVSALASQLVRYGIHHVTGSVLGDESYLDSLRGEPSSGYTPDPFLGGALSGLAFNRGATGSERGPHAPAAYAARRLWAALKSDGVSIAGRPGGTGVTPAGASQLAQVSSPTLTTLLGLTLPPSDNYMAETLLKDLGARYAGAGTTAAGAAVVRQTLASLLGIHPQVVDGSGLSPSNRTSPYHVADLLVETASTPIGPVLRDNLAIAGHTGTLATRMRHTGASGHCQGKTGTLTGVSNLVGYCTTAGGHTLAYAIFTDGLATSVAHRFQDHMTITIANY